MVIRSVAAVTEIDDRWRREILEWALPEEVTRLAPRSPWVFDPSAFAPDFDAAMSSSHQALALLVAEASREGGPAVSVMDVGAGAGAGVLALGGSIARVIAVDQSLEMLEVFVEEALRFPNLAVETRVGEFLSMADELPVVDAVTSHHMVYNVSELVAYVEGLTRCARVGVVIEMTLRHPHYALGLLWRELWGLERPHHPTADDVVEVLVALGYSPIVSIGGEPTHRRGLDAGLEGIRQRLCLGPERDSDIERALGQGYLLPNPSVTISWRVERG
ncbi:MAG: class I SAM-dependent methyltransferase [Ferrimicrobium sp.]